MPTGQLIGGELYIDHSASWYRNIKVRLRYTGALNAFYPSYSPLPFITTDGQLFQREGVLWLLQQRKNHHSCLLADEMGLGKTLQVIAHLCCLGTDKRHLIIAPTSLIYNWQHEVLRFAPHLLPSLTLVSYDMLRIHLDEYVHQAFATGVSGRVSSIALEGLLRLRQACVSPNLLPQTISRSSHIESTKLQTALDLIL